MPSFHRDCFMTTGALLLLLLSSQLSTAQATGAAELSSQNKENTRKLQSFQCDFANDSCPFARDGECDNFDCPLADCEDCDPCRAFDLSCGDCVNSGCHYCPGDAKCWSANDHPIVSNTRCESPDDYVSFSSSSTCESASAGGMFSDPLFVAESWAYDQINLIPAWEAGWTGKGVRVRINDDGVEASHPEFQGRFDLGTSCVETGNYLPSGETGHGTFVASIVGGAADNGMCAVGVAPEVTLSSCDVLSDLSVSYLDYKLDSFDISQNSYGPETCTIDPDRGSQRRQLQTDSCPFDIRPNEFPCSGCDFSNKPISSFCRDEALFYCVQNYFTERRACVEVLDVIFDPFLVCEDTTIGTAIAESFARGAMEGRDGKGVVFVFASGNSREFSTEVNNVGLINNRFVISVGATDPFERSAIYSSGGPALFLAAPGGDFDFLQSHVGAGLGGSCIALSSGTSFSAPVVSGVVALMLEANNELTWRDVQGILAATARIPDVDDGVTVTNAVGVKHSSDVGFGIVDAFAAVEAAQTWELYSPERLVAAQSKAGEILSIADNANRQTTSTIEVPDGNLVIESVVLYMNLRHFSRGDLTITLTSPMGTQSSLLEGGRNENTQLGSDEEWRLLTYQMWGESAGGEWTLTLTDEEPGNVEQCADNDWTMPIGVSELGCHSLDAAEVCVDGVYNAAQLNLVGGEYKRIFGVDGISSTTTANFRDESSGLTFLEACCACGGGLSPFGFQNELVQWRLAIYGHDGAQGSSGSPNSPNSPSDPNLPGNNSAAFGASLAWLALVSGLVVMTLLSS